MTENEGILKNTELNPDCTGTLGPRLLTGLFLKKHSTISAYLEGFCFAKSPGQLKSLPALSDLLEHPKMPSHHIPPERPRTETDPYRRRIKMKETSSNTSAPWLEQKKADHSIVPDQVPVHITVADRQDIHQALR
ncbi:hypothetical protein AMECASPLE_018103 [Ameca splendens]|uniref:Uncharacterized protein n=1 Tax=Ameca splendens TaxID=208324 RepID=A0ABV0Y329_9TELE